MSDNQVLEILLNDVRLSYFSGYEPQVNTNDDGSVTKSYGSHLIFAKTHPQLPRVIEMIKTACNNAWKDQGPAMYEQLKAQDKLCLRIGDIAKPGQDGYGGNLFISSNSKVRPRILATRGGSNVEVPAGQPDSPYSGCQANAKIQIWAQLGGKTKSGKPIPKRINAQLMGVQFLRHGEAFGGGRIANLEEFGIVANDADGTPAAAAGNGVQDFM